MNVPARILGNTGVSVTLMGLGGEGILRTFGHDSEAYELINLAVDLGINYFESARAYSGSEIYYGNALRERRKDIFLTSKSHARDRQGALEHLEQTLSNMKTDHLDLWQIHDIRTKDDVDQIMGKGGAIEAFDLARSRGMARFLGVTGHHDPYVLEQIINLYDFDTVLIPVNPAEPHYKCFLDLIAPVASKKKMGIVGMKVYFRGMAQRIPGFPGMLPFFRYALSQPVSLCVVGCDSTQQLRENVSFAKEFDHMSVEEKLSLEQYVQPFARSLMYYKP